MLNDADIDIACICVPHNKTIPIAIDCLDTGCHVFAEKPPGTCLDDVKQLQSVMHEHPELKVKFGFNHRYYSHIQKAHSIIYNGDFGEVLWMRGIYGKAHLENWRSNKELAGHGILLSQGIHMLDLMRYLSSDEFIVNDALMRNEEYADGIEDNVFVLMRSKAKHIDASIHSSSILWDNTFSLHIGLAEGLIKIEGLNTSSRSFGFPEEIRILDSRGKHYYGCPPEDVYYYGIDTSWQEEVDEFVYAIHNKKPIKHGTIHDAVAVMKLIEDIYGYKK